MVGASFTGFTVKINVWESEKSPSDTNTVTSIKPLKLSYGAMVS